MAHTDELGFKYDKDILDAINEALDSNEKTD